MADGSDSLGNMVKCMFRIGLVLGGLCFVATGCYGFLLPHVRQNSINSLGDCPDGTLSVVQKADDGNFEAYCEKQADDEAVKHGPYSRWVFWDLQKPSNTYASNQKSTPIMAPVELGYYWDGERNGVWQKGFKYVQFHRAWEPSVLCVYTKARCACYKMQESWDKEGVEVFSLYISGRLAYSDGRWREASESFEKGTELAKSARMPSLPILAADGDTGDLPELQVGADVIELLRFATAMAFNRTGRFKEAKAILTELLKSAAKKGDLLPRPLVALELSISETGMGRDDLAKRTLAPFRKLLLAAVKGKGDQLQVEQCERLAWECSEPLPYDPDVDGKRPIFEIRRDWAGIFRLGTLFEDVKEHLPAGWTMQLVYDAPVVNLQPVYHVLNESKKLQLILFPEPFNAIGGIDILGADFKLGPGVFPGAPLDALDIPGGLTDYGLDDLGLERWIGIDGVKWFVDCPDNVMSSIVDLFPDSVAGEENGRAGGALQLLAALRSGGCSLKHAYIGRDSARYPDVQPSRDDVEGMSKLCAQIGCETGPRCEWTGWRGCQSIITDESCAKSGLCMREGLCAAGDGECVKCKDGAACKSRGECSWVNGACGVGSDSDCSKSRICLESGLCSFRKAEGCVLASSSDCRKTTMCKKEGRCSWSKEEGCFVGGNGDCRGSQLCKDSERCFERDGQCVTRWITMSTSEKRKNVIGRCRSIMANLKKLKSRYAAAVRSGDGDAQWALDAELSSLDAEFQGVGYDIREVEEELREEGSEAQLRQFVNDVRNNCSL